MVTPVHATVYFGNFNVGNVPLNQGFRRELMRALMTYNYSSDPAFIMSKNTSINTTVLDPDEGKALEMMYKLANLTDPNIYTHTIVTKDVLPITLTYFNAKLSQGKFVALDWKTISEINNYGTSVQKKIVDATNDFSDISNSFQPGHGTTTVAQNYSFTDSTAKPGRWLYRLKQVDLDGTVNPSQAVEVDVPSIDNVPDKFALNQNYPNPFNPSTTISYYITKNEPVSLKVFDALGREVSTLVNEKQDVGSHNVSFSGQNLSSGTYFYRLQTPEKAETKRMMLVK